MLDNSDEASGALLSAGMLMACNGWLPSLRLPVPVLNLLTVKQTISSAYTLALDDKQANATPSF